MTLLQGSVKDQTGRSTSANEQICIMEKNLKALRRHLSLDSLGQWLFSPAAKRYLTVLIVLGVLLASAFLGQHPSWLWLLLLGAVSGALILFHIPQLGLLAIISVALLVRFEISTGTEVSLNLATLLIPALVGLKSLESLRTRKLRWAASSVNRPLTLFLLAGLLSFLIGNVTWDPAVPKSGSFWLVQLAQWAVFAFAAFIFWLVANILEPETWLPRLTWFFLILGGGAATLYVLPRLFNVQTVSIMGYSVVGFVIQCAPFWMLLTAISGGQLLFNRDLRRGTQLFLVALVIIVLYYSFFSNRESSSVWVSVVAVLGILIWLRWPQLRWPIILLVALLAVFGSLFSSVYEFAGGDEDWERTGGSRLVLIGRVLSVTLRNPITGLGPASYRNYAGVEPLKYGLALWVNPRINSHNNWVDLFAHTGLLGLGLFIWFAVELGLLGLRLSKRYRENFVGGYVNGMLAAWVSSLLLMMFADWILPFVYNIGFPGFRASLLVWLFLGGLVALEQVRGLG